MMKPTRHDGLLAVSLVAAALVIAAVFFVVRAAEPEADRVAVVRIDEREILRLPLGEDTVQVTETGHTVTIKDGAASVSAAPCPDRICVHHFAIRHTGECIVCLPEKLTVTVEEG